MVFHTPMFSVSPRFDSPFFEGEGRVRNDEIQININGSAETATGLAGPHRAVKGKEIGKRRHVRDAAGRTLKPIAESNVTFRFDPEIEPSFAEPKSEFQGIHDSLFI